jgi:uncharacterized protein (TIGR04255 family)
VSASLRALRKRERVIYVRNPLVEVIAAVRFPPVLGLLQEPPSEFQRIFAKEYPLAEFAHSISAVLPGSPQPEKVNLSRTYSFLTPDKSWRINIESNLLALTCQKYTEWRDFRARFAVILNDFFRVYGVGLVTRVGLRYKDVINKAALGLDGATWRELIEPPVLGTVEFFTDDLDKNPGMDFALVLSIPPGSLRVGFSLVQNPDKQVGFLIDTDCFSEDQKPADVGALLDCADELHKYSNSVFQACITDRLHKALQDKQ